MFRRLASAPEIELKVFHGESVPGTKMQNGRDMHGFEREELRTWVFRVRASSRETAMVFSPGLFGRLRNHNPDVILAEGGSNLANNVLVFLYAKLFRKDVVWWTLGMLEGRKHRGLASRAYRAVVVGMERMSSALLGYSSVALRYFDRMGYPRERCFRAVNCVDTDLILEGVESDIKRAAELRGTLHLEGAFVVLFVGALVASKQIDRLVRAFAELHRTNARARLVIVGDGSDRIRLESLCSELGVRAEVVFTGEVIEGVGAYYELGDVFVLPGLGGLAVSEAMAHGLPVICGRGDGCEVDLVRNGETGFRLEAESEPEYVKELADRLTRIGRDRALCDAMGIAGRRVIDTEHNVRSYIANIVASVRFATRRASRGAMEP